MQESIDALTADRLELAQRIAQRHFQKHPELLTRYGSKGRESCVQDGAYHLQYLEQALRVDSEQLFADYVRWAKIMLEARDVPLEDLRSNLQTVAEVTGDALPDLRSSIEKMIAAGLRSLEESEFEEAAEIPHSDLAQAYLTAVLAGERLIASRLVTESIGNGVSLRDIYLHVFQPTQYEIGRLWQRNEIGVADEHLATAITQMIMSQLYPMLFSGPRKPRTFVSACVGGELHEIGARMVADFFEMEGWKTYYLGANTPADGIIKAINERKADVAGISVTISYNVGAAQEIIRDLRNSPGGSDVKVIVGGYPFRVAPELWKTVGADGFAADAAEAINLAERLVDGGSP